MSIKPKWVAKILNGEKTIEIRKRFPKDYRGWVYIYCTKEDNLCCIRKIYRDRYICGKDFDIKDFPELSSGYEGNGKVVARFWCDEVYTYDIQYQRTWSDELFAEVVNKNMCLTLQELHTYVGDKVFHGIHISKLEIFDKPRELGEFMPIKWNKCNIKDKNGLYQCDKCPFGGNWWEHGSECRYGPLTKAPQSWQYIEI